MEVQRTLEALAAEKSVLQAQVGFPEQAANLVLRSSHVSEIPIMEALAAEKAILQMQLGSSEQAANLVLTFACFPYFLDSSQVVEADSFVAWCPSAEILRMKRLCIPILHALSRCCRPSQ